MTKPTRKNNVKRGYEHCPPPPPTAHIDGRLLPPPPRSMFITLAMDAGASEADANRYLDQVIAEQGLEIFDDRYATWPPEVH